MAPPFCKFSKLFRKRTPVTDCKPKRDPRLRHSRSFPGPLSSHAKDVHGTCTPFIPRYAPGTVHPGGSHAVDDSILRKSSSTLGSEIGDLIPAFPQPPAPELPDEEFQECIEAGRRRYIDMHGVPTTPRRSASSASTYLTQNQRPPPSITARRGNSEDIGRPCPKPRYVPRAGAPQPLLYRTLNASSGTLASTKERTPPTYVPKVEWPPVPGALQLPKRPVNNTPLNDIYKPAPARTPNHLYGKPRFAQSTATLATSFRPPGSSRPARGHTLGNSLYANPSANQSTSTVSSRGYHTPFANSEQTLVSANHSTTSVHRIPGSTPIVAGTHALRLREGLERSRTNSLVESTRTGRSTASTRGMNRPFNPVKFARSTDSKWSECRATPIDIDVIGEDFSPIRRAPAVAEVAATTPKSKTDTFKDRLRKLRSIKPRRSEG